MLNTMAQNIYISDATHKRFKVYHTDNQPAKSELSVVIPIICMLE